MVDTPTQAGSVLLENQQASVIDYLKGYFRRITSGDLGSLPIIIGLVFIALIFQSQNANFLKPINLLNLIAQMAGTTVMAYGVVFVLLLGEIDLSIGYVSAVAGVTVAMLLRDPAAGWQWYTAIPVALLVSAGIGLLHGLIITFFKVPSFIVTLAGLMAWNGVVIRLVGSGGTVIIQDKFVTGIANSSLPNDGVLGWIILVTVLVVYALLMGIQYRRRRIQNLSTPPVVLPVMQVIFLAVVGVALLTISSMAEKGLPVIGLVMMTLLIILTFVVRNTPFGRYIYAIGGNQEAARRAGINVTRIRIMVFMLSSTLAGMGGIILASRARSVSSAEGGGNLLLNAIAAAVIGGTSLFGGRGHMSSAVLGALVISGVDNGMGLIGLASGDKFIVTGIVLLVAVIVDSLSRRRQQQSGIA